MSNDAGDGLHFQVDVDGAPGRAELQSLIEKIRALGREGTEAGGKIDSAMRATSRATRDLADDVAHTLEIEQKMERSVAQSEASRSRATTAALNTDTAGTRGRIAVAQLANTESSGVHAGRQQENRNLETQSRVALLEDRREILAEDRQTKFEKAKSKEITDRAAQEDAAWGKRGQQLESESKAQNKIAQQIDAEFSKKEQGRAADAKAVNAAAQTELKDIRAAEAATEQRFEKQGQAARAAVKAEMRRSDDNIMNDVMAHQNVSSVANLNATRYALYDVATTAAIVGGTVTAIGGYAVLTASKFEYAFSSVDRAAQLTDANVGQVRDQLVNLSTTVPNNFEDIAGIATLGAQMGVGASALDDFSNTVAKFTATTNASSEVTAQAFGRISSLLDVPTSKFENLGSAIAEVGVKSVATETEILQTTQQISGAAAVYGFTADQVVGLGAAFASLAVAPEAARGSVTRIFGKIEKAVSSGGEAMTGYARILGTTTKTAGDMWKKDPSGFFQKLVQGLSASTDKLKALESIGAKDVRDQNLLQRLAKSPEVLNKALATSARSYQEGTYLSEAYAVQTDNLQSSLSKLKNTFDALAAGSAGGLNVILKTSVDILTWFLNIVRGANPVVMGVLVAVTLLIGGLILMKGAQAAAIASLLAMQSALKGVASNAALSGISLRTLTTISGQMFKEMTVGSGAVGAAATKLRMFSVAAVGVGKSILAMGVIGAVLWAISEGANLLGDAMASPSEKAQKLLGDTTGLSDAIKADTQTWSDGGKAIITFSTKLDKAKAATDTTKLAVESWTGANKKAANAVDHTTKKLDQQRIALGKNADMWTRKKLSEQQGIIDLANNPALVAAFKGIGGNIDTLVTRTMKGTSGKYLDGLVRKARQAQIDLEKNAPKRYLTGDETLKMRDQQSALNDVIGILNGSVRDATGGVEVLVQQERVGANTAALMGTNTKDLGDESDTTATKMDDLKAALDNLFSGVTSEADFYSSVQGLYTALYASHDAFNTFSEEGRASFKALQQTMLDTISYGQTLGMSAQDSLLPLFTSLQQNGVDTSALLHQLASDPLMFSADIDVSALIGKINAVTGGSSILTDNQDYLSLAMNATAKSANDQAASLAKVGGGGGGGGGGGAADKAAKSVRTLTEYVSDLGTVFDSAFTIRFGLEQSLDDVASKWNAIRDANKEATKAAVGYQNELNVLKATKSALQYQLKIAVDYGDTKGADEIRAQLASTNSDIASKQQDVADATSKGSKELKGNSKAAIDNRANLRDLTKSYEDQIKAAANSGLSQGDLKRKVADLKAEFIRQATQLGYNRDDVKKYAAAFDDVSYAVKRMPRGFTIVPSVDPGARAFAEFQAKATAAASKAGTAAGRAYKTAFEGVPKPKATPLLVPIGFIMPKYATLMKMQAAIRAATGDTKFRVGTGPGGQGGQVFQNSRGGFVPGAMGDRNVDNLHLNMPGIGTLGLQGGEPIMTNAARSMYGDQMFKDINALKFKPAVQQTIVHQGGNTSGVMQLSAEDRRIMAQGGNVAVNIFWDTIGQASSMYNKNASLRGGG